MTKRILYVANARLPTENAHGHAMVKMCEAYARIGLEVQLWFPRRHQADPRLRDATVFEYYGVYEGFRTRSLLNVDVIPLESWFPKRAFRFLTGAHDLIWAWYAARRASREHFVLHHTRNAAVALCLARAGLETLLETHNPPAGLRRQLIRRLAKQPHLRGVVALTDACRNSLLTLGIADSKIIVLGSCVDLDAYAELPSKTECREALGLPTDREIVGYVGRFQTYGGEKGIPTLIDALSVLRQDSGRSPLLLCVGGPMTPVPRYLEIAAAAQTPIEDLHFVDHVPSSEIPMWIGACDIGVIPSPNRGYFVRFASPLKVFEFQAGGVAILASNLPSLREVLVHGENAWLIEPDDTNALADGLARLLADEELRRTLGTRGRLDVTDHTWIRRAERIWARFGPDSGTSAEMSGSGADSTRARS